MKKLAFLFAAVVAVSFASCGNKTAENTEAVDSDTIAVEEVEEVACCGDSCCADSCCEAPAAE